VQEPSAFEATLRFAAALAQDGATGVTVIVPRARGVLARARDLAQAAGVSVFATDVGSESITMRFSATPRDVSQSRLLRRRTG
jgi:hypothetical protein